MARSIVLVLLVLVACDQGSSAPPKPAPVIARDAYVHDASDPCAAALADVERANAAIKKAIADQNLEETTVEWLPMPFTIGITGVPPAPKDVERERREWAPFDGKQTGDLVRWTTKGQHHEGIVVELGEWYFVKRGTDLLLATPRSVRTVTCEDATRPRSNCGMYGRATRAFAVPAGMKFGGIIKIDVERVEMQTTGGKCPAPPA